MKSVERDALYRDVWSRPATKIALELGIAGSALKRICSMMGVPTPPAGHWSKISAGHKIAPAKLPPATADTLLFMALGSRTSEPGKQKPAKGPELTKPAGQDAEASPPSGDLENLHSLVKSTRAQLREEYKNVLWDQRKDRRRLAVGVSEGMLDRACLFLDSIVREIERRGFTFRCKLDAGGSEQTRLNDSRDRMPRSLGVCGIQVGNERLTFYLREPERREPIPPDEKGPYLPDYRKVPGGYLECTIGDSSMVGVQTLWKDRKVNTSKTTWPEWWLLSLQLPKLKSDTGKLTKNDKIVGGSERNWIEPSGNSGGLKTDWSKR